MPTKRGRYFYVDRSFGRLGRVHRSLRTRSASRARFLEQMLVRLHDRGREDLVRAFAEGELSIARLAKHFETSTLPELTAALRTSNATLKEVVSTTLRVKAGDVKESTLSRYRTSLEHFVYFAGAEQDARDSLTTDTIQEFKAQRLEEGLARATVNNDLIAVSVACTVALRRGWIESRPEISKFPTQVRISYLEPTEIREYIAALRPAFEPLFKLLIGTGIRLGEAESLRACDLRIGKSEARASIRDSKTAPGIRTVFLPSWVRQAVEAHLEKHGRAGRDSVFTIPRRTVQKEHGRACQAVDIVEYTIHDHRHTAAVLLARAGMPLNLIQRQLGHSRIRQTMRYAQFHPEYADVDDYFTVVGDRLGLGPQPRG